MKTIEENNRMIAEFMGMQYTQIGWYDNEEFLNLSYTKDNTFDELLFHTSWDWLMPVVEEIKLSGFVYGDRGYEAIDRLDNSIMDINIDEVHKICVDIIEWYNNHKAIEDEIAYDMDRD